MIGGDQSESLITVHYMGIEMNNVKSEENRINERVSGRYEVGKLPGLNVEILV